MCGILGFVGIKVPVEACVRERALATIKTRGPDEQSWWADGPVTLGHTRLAVIDPVMGHQPMTTPDGRYTVVFNGEIYNYRELRQELLLQGACFTTASDSEVLLQGFSAWGEAMLPRLDGMFAFAVWDAREKRLFLARDRLGIKPLFYSRQGGFAFASTLAPFFELPWIGKALDYEALRDYLAFQTCLAPHSFLSGVRQLCPGQCLTYDLATGEVKTRTWWALPKAEPGAYGQEDLLDAADRALGESVRRQLVADVPLGAFLSGGIDSSLIVRYMAEAASGPLRTFSVRFAEEGYDETSAALAVAERFGTRHTVLDAPIIGVDTLTQAIHDMDQPIADPAYVMTWELSRQTRQHVTVALSGDGGDELFAGYPRYADEASQYPATTGKRVLQWLVTNRLAPAALTRRGLWGDELLLYRRSELGPWAGTRKSLASYLNREAFAASHADRVLQRWRDLIRDLGGRMDTATLMRADWWTYLSENCLTKADRASMAHGLEVRVPFLGQPVLALAQTLPADVHFDQEGGKALLRELARRSLPEAVWNREKHGFSVPLHSYFSGSWQPWCEAMVQDAARLAPYLKADNLAGLWSRARSGRGSRRLAYTFLVLLGWLHERKLSLE